MAPDHRETLALSGVFRQQFRKNPEGLFVDVTSRNVKVVAMERIPWAAGRGEGANPTQSKFKIPAILFLLMLTGFAFEASAGLPIEILENKNSTLLRVSSSWFASGTNYTQRQSSILPINDTIYSWNGAIAGVASAGQFEVSTITKRLETVTPADNIRAFSTNEVSFQSLATATATLGFEKSITGGFHVNDNQIRVKLIEADSGQVLLNYYWDRSVGNSGVGSTQVDFNAGANYKLSISAWSIEDNAGPSYGGWPQTVASLRITGFDSISVPEPAAASIVGLGLLAWWSQRRGQGHVA